MRTRSKRVDPYSANERVPTLDRAHLAHYTLENLELEREIVLLFLQQLPETRAMLDTAKSQADWKLAAHTLKGSAAVVGAGRINALAAALEKCKVGSAKIRDLLRELDKAIAQFKKAATRIYA